MIIDAIVNGELDWKGLIDKLASRPVNKSIWSIIQRLLLAATVYFLWQERNFRLFQGKQRSADVLCNIIIDMVRFRLLGLKINETVQSRLVAEIWRFGMDYG